MFGCLVKLLVYGDPQLDPQTDAYWQHKQRADSHFAQGQAAQAYAGYLNCLHMFGLSLPTSRVECYLQTTWQFLRFLFHRLWLGRVLSRRTGGLFSNATSRKQALASARELTLLFNRLNQLQLTGNGSRGHIHPTNGTESRNRYPCHNGTPADGRDDDDFRGESKDVSTCCSIAEQHW